MNTKKRSRQELQYLRDEALQAYLNREDFQYDLNGDALYQQYKDRYMDLGKKAMQDTMGQASALTGGYGSSYAQNVGQQAYNSYMQQLGDVVPELYKLAYDRYQDRGDQLYKTYQSWAQLEQEAADQEQKDREYALAEQKRQDENARIKLELESKISKNQTQNQTQTGAPQSDYFGWLAYQQGEGSRPYYNDPRVTITYDNQNVTTGNIMTMQRVLGLPETGMWTLTDRQMAGGMEADRAWMAYQRGHLQNLNSHSLGDVGVSDGNIKTMERVLGLKEDGVWSKEDKEAAGGLSASTAWDAYTKGLLQLRR